MKKIFFLYILSFLFFMPLLATINSAITWEPNGGRFGDNLQSYAYVKWLSYKFNIPVLYLPFKYSDQLVLHHQEAVYTKETAKKFSHQMRLPYKTKFRLFPDNNTLYISHWDADVTINWSDMAFINSLRQTISPRNSLTKVIIPEYCISIAAHVRTGGGFVVDDKKERERCPLRFVPNDFYIDQIRRLAEMFKDENLYVHIFTDHPNPKVLKKKFKKALNNPRITFGYRENDNAHNANVLEDFFSMMDFDCLIRPGSHYSRFVQRLGNNKVVIYPESIKKNPQGKPIINVITVKTRTHGNEKWKTKKITIA
jgi:hypothetical protein